jgi:hypothetical protein
MGVSGRVAMQKVVGSSPIIRSRNACKLADAVVTVENGGCAMAAVVVGASSSWTLGVGDSRGVRLQ